MIGKSNILDGLYVFQNTLIPIGNIFLIILLPILVHKKNTLVQKWHYKVGHLSDDVLRLIHVDCNRSLPNHFSCKEFCICPLAKQKHVPFIIVKIDETNTHKQEGVN